MICSPYVSDEDATALANGYSAKNDELLAESLAKEVQALFDDPFLSAPAKLLAYMISKGIIDVKIAVPTGNESPNAKRLFHDKVGIFTDSDGNRVGFRGSMNETYKGLSSDGNMESIDVFPNWLDGRDAERVDDASAFLKNYGQNLFLASSCIDFRMPLKKYFGQNPRSKLARTIGRNPC